MRHRAKVRVETPTGPPSTPDERRLDRVQTELTRAALRVDQLTSERDALALHLWLDRRMAQAEIAELLDTADRRAGGDGITYAALQRRLWRNRESIPVAN